jgi:hypothetical protein
LVVGIVRSLLARRVSIVISRRMWWLSLGICLVLLWEDVKPPRGLRLSFVLGRGSEAKGDWWVGMISFPLFHE